MAEIKKLKPAGAALVRKPDGKHLKPEGERVELTPYWIRRLAEKEVVEVNEAPAKPAAPKNRGGE